MQQIRSHSLIKCLVFWGVLLVQCTAHDETACRNTYGIAQECAENDVFGCECVLEQTKCYTSNQCKVVLKSQELCVNAFGVGEEIWLENCGLYYEVPGDGLLEGWICIFSFSLVLCLFLCYKAKFHVRKRMQTYELLIISFLLLSILFWGYYFINLFIAVLAVLTAFLFVVTFSNIFEYPETKSYDQPNDIEGVKADEETQSFI
jgi:hypothetical protein